MPRIPACNNISHYTSDTRANTEAMTTQAGTYMKPFDPGYLAQRWHYVWCHVDHAGPSLFKPNIG